uniref:Prominin-1-A-like n=1 Tax=Gouania willdenowi TaxID=441366 RepID=A0A8C5GHI8_GOUWI
MTIPRSGKEWRWQESTTGFPCGLGLLLVLLLLPVGVSDAHLQQKSCLAAEGPQLLRQPQYKDFEQKDPNVGFLGLMVQPFLHMIQPKPFPQDLFLEVIGGQFQLNQDFIKRVLVYEVGFLVCLAIAVVYIILLPFVGLILAGCRCCGNCGGKMYQKQTPSTHCNRRAFYWSALVTTLIILAGNVIMFKSNQDLNWSVTRGSVKLKDTLDNVQTYLSAVPLQLDTVVNESYKTVQKVSENLNNIGAQLGVEIQNQFKGTLNPVLLSVNLLDQETVNISVELKTLNSSLTEQQLSLDRLQSNVSAVKNRINATLSKPNCVGCEDFRPELQKITVDATITIPSLNELQSAVDEVLKSDLQSKLKEVDVYFQNIPQRMTNDIEVLVSSSKQVLDEIKTQVSQIASDIPLSTLTTAIQEFLNFAETEIQKVLPIVERAEYIRWSVCVALSCVVLFVVACYLLGLTFGPAGLKPKVDPTKRSCTADCGGTFLMMGAGFSFLFSALLMIAVAISFVPGGNVYTVFCRPWDNGQILKFLDTPGLIPLLDIGVALGVTANVNISDLYRDCQKNQSLWMTLHLYQLVNLEEQLNVTRYTEEIVKKFESTNVTLTTINLLDSEIKNKLSTFSTQVDNFKIDAVTERINNLTSINLNTTADKLDQAADSQSSPDIESELHSEANDLRHIQTDIETNIIPQLENLESTIKSLRSTLGKINATVGEVLSSVGAAQDFLHTNTSVIVKTESRKFLDCQLNYFTVYTQWANRTITQQLGLCGPVVDAVDSVVVIVCKHGVESLNTFWFCLGWCIIFFIPGIIFSIKLAKYYRRMKYSDVYE